MALDPPWRLDPIKNIVGVGWRSGGKAILLQLYRNSAVNAANVAPPAPFEVVFMDYPVLDIEGLSLLGEIPPVVTPPAKGSGNIWSFAKHVKFDTDTILNQDFSFVDRGLYHIQTSAGVYTSVVDTIFGTQVPFIIDYTGDLSGGGELNVIDGRDPSIVAGHMDFATGGLQATFIEPLLVEVLASHTSVTTYHEIHKEGTTFTFLKPSNGSSNTLAFTIIVAGQDKYSINGWDLQVITWLSVGVFSRFEVGGDVFLTNDKPNTDFAQASADFSEGINRPKQIDIEIDLTTMMITGLVVTEL